MSGDAEGAVSKQDWKAETDRWLEAGAPESFKDSTGMDCDWSCFVTELGLCGCGSPERVYAELLRLMVMIRDSTDERWKLTATEELAFNWIHHRGWTTHGSTIYGSWLTDDGKRAMRILEAAIRLRNSR